ncbi:MAG: SUMF1/EgtB/PvdO family nonheme iron enzyme [Elusimicrobiota bacterium]
MAAYHQLDPPGFRPRRRSRTAIRRARRAALALCGVLLAAEPAGGYGCPKDMAAVGESFCIDRYEASRPDATGLSGGEDGSRATSRRGVMPWYVKPMSIAALRVFDAACRAAGKRLCEREEWLQACAGPRGSIYPFGDRWDREACNSADAFCDDYCAQEGISPCGTAEDCGYRYNSFRIAPTGSFPRCTNGFGLFDLSGNVWEVVPGDAPRGYEVRGGAFNCARPSERLKCAFSAGWDNLSAGFRCCKDRD